VGGGVGERGPGARPERVGAGRALTPPPVRPAPRVEPISEELRVLRMTVGRAFVADLGAVRSALSHQIPDGNLEKVLHACVRRMLRDRERRRRGSGRAAGSPAGGAEGRYIQAAGRDEVWRRDQGRCTFLARTGTAAARRISSRSTTSFRLRRVDRRRRTT